MTNKKLADQGSVALGLISSTHSFLMTFKIHVCTSSIQFAVTDMERDSPGSCNKYLYGSSRIRSEAAWVSLSIASSVHKSIVEDKEQKKTKDRHFWILMSSPEYLYSVLFSLFNLLWKKVKIQRSVEGKLIFLNCPVINAIFSFTHLDPSNQPSAN